MKQVLVGAAAALGLSFAVTASADFSFKPAGDLINGSGSGRTDDKVYVPGMRFPFESAPAFLNSQVWGHGGYKGPGGGQCDAENYSYPWRDNYCESRSWSMPLCPSGKGHQGQDMRPATCQKSKHWTVASVDGRITNIGKYSVSLTRSDGTRFRYLHVDMRKLPVKTGQTVKKGDRIGLTSNDFGGTPTTIHLHYDIRQNVSGLGNVYVSPYMSLVESYKVLIGEVDDDNDPPPPTTGRALGVIWDLSTSTSPSGGARIADATIDVEGGPNGTSRSGDGFWSFDLDPGTYTITASAPGFASASREVEISSDQDSWASIGLSPSLTSTLDVTVTDKAGQPLSNAIAYVPGLGMERTGANGTVSFTVDPGTYEAQIFHDGYAGQFETVDVASGTSQPLTVALSAAVPPPSSGRLQGVVWDGSTSSSPSGSSAVRIDDAILLCSCGIAVETRSVDAYWRFDVAPGTHTFTVLADGYETLSFDRYVGAGDSAWASQALTPR